MSELNTENRVLASVLGASDALWVPFRARWNDQTERRRCTVVYEVRRDFSEMGVPWSPDVGGIKGGTVARKAASDAVRELASQGYVSTSKQAYGRAHRMRLTDQGDEKARVMCGLPTMRSSWLFLEKMESFRGGPFAATGASVNADTPVGQIPQAEFWVNEIMVVGAPLPKGGRIPKWIRRQIVWQEEMALPAMMRGLVVSMTDVKGTVFYGLTPQGAAYFQQVPADDPRAYHEDDDHDYAPKTEKLRAVYYAAFAATGAALKSIPPQTENEIGMFPGEVRHPEGWAEAWSAYPTCDGISDDPPVKRTADQELVKVN